jgi:hypothetical protein
MLSWKYMLRNDQWKRGMSYSRGARVGASIGEAWRGLGAADMIGESIGLHMGEGE